MFDLFIMMMQQQGGFAYGQNTSIQNLIRILLSKQMSLKRATKQLLKLIREPQFLQQLIHSFHRNTSIILKTNMLLIIGINAGSIIVSDQNKRKQLKMWCLRQNYELRYSLQSLSWQESMQILSGLNRSLLSTLEQSRNRSFYQAQFYIQILPSFRHTRFSNIINIMFQCNMILQIIKIYQKQSPQLLSIVAFSISVLESNKLGHLPLQKMAVQLYCRCRSLPLIQNIGNFAEQLSLHGKLLLANNFQVQIEWKSLINHLISNEEELLLVSRLLAKFQMASREQGRQKMCQFWLQGWMRILQQGQNCQTGLNQLPQQILITIYFKLSSALANSKTQQKQFLLLMWRDFMISQELIHLVQKNKNIFINLQLFLYDQLRKITGQLPRQAFQENAQIILEVYSAYSHILLQQKQLNSLREAIAKLIIRRYPGFITYHMLLQDRKKAQSNTTDTLVELNKCKEEYLQQLWLQNRSHLNSILSQLDGNVGKVWLKYLLSKHLSISDLIGCQGVIDYAIMQGIQIHLDKCDYILEQKLLKNLPHYIQLIGNNTQSPYAYKLNNCILQLMANQLQSYANIQLLSTVFQVVLYLVKNLPRIIDLLSENTLSVNQLRAALLSFVCRSLYSCPPVLCYSLLASTLALIPPANQSDTQCFYLTLQHLNKFIKMFNSHKYYTVCGLASMFLLLYGLPQLPWSLPLNASSVQILQKSNNFLLKIIDILANESLPAKRCDLFESKDIDDSNVFALINIFNKSFIWGLISHIRNVAIKNIKTSANEIRQINQLLEQNLIGQTTDIFEKIKPICSKKRLIDIDFFQVEKGGQESEKQHKTDEKLSLGVEKLKFLWENYDQYLDYSRMQKQVMQRIGCRQLGTLGMMRVHGKVRNIVQLRK